MIIAQEVIHSIKAKKGKVGWMTIKLYEFYSSGLAGILLGIHSLML
jgi:hypothetical protein